MFEQQTNPAPSVALPASFGAVTCGFVDALASPPKAYFGTDGSPGGVVAVSLNPAGPTLTGVSPFLSSM